jgi:hypothetical protein
MNLFQQEFIVKLGNGEDASDEEVEALLTSIGAVLGFREDLIPVAHSILRPLTVDLIMTLGLKLITMILSVHYIVPI